LRFPSGEFIRSSGRTAGCPIRFATGIVPREVLASDILIHPVSVEDAGAGQDAENGIVLAPLLFSSAASTCIFRRPLDETGPPAHSTRPRHPHHDGPMIRSAFLRRLAILPAFLLPAAAPAVHAQAPAPAVAEARTIVDPALTGVDSMLTALYPVTEPGTAVLVARDGQVLMRKAYGSANVELGVPLRPEHVFRLGSITKQFTAVAVLMLVDEGKVSLDDEITRWFPGYPTHGHRITVEHLLTHTSGILNYTGVPAYLAGMRRDLTPDELIATFRDQPMDFAPGERWSYNNSGYALLGAIIEKVSGMSYGDFIRTRIFEPLGMRNSYYETANALVPGRVSGYDRTPDGVRLANYVSMTQPYAAGSLISTVDDQLVWQRAVAEGRMLKPETWRRAFSPYRLSGGLSARYGYGWFMGEAAGRPSIEHGGDIDGFSTNGLWIPSERLYVIVLANHKREPQRNPDEISRQIASRLLGPPPAPAPFAVGEDALQEYAGVYRLNETENRLIIREGGTLWAQRGRNPRQQLTPRARDEFAFASGTRARFVRGADGKITGIVVGSRIGPEEMAPRTEEQVEAVLAAQNTPVRVPVEVLRRYVGVYQIAPGFEITVRLDGDVLRALPSNQGETVLVPESETRFYAPQANATMIFETDASGAATRLVLHHSGRQMPAAKIR
jgi:D-alanyl-D-alanine carboxypeptidase